MFLPIHAEEYSSQVSREAVTLPCNTVSSGASRELLLFTGVVPVTKTALDPFLKEAELLQVKVLIDSGAAVTFVSDVLVQRLGLQPVQQPSPVQVRYSDGRTRPSPGRVEIPVSIQGRVLQLNATVAPLEAADVILGIDWHRQHDVQIQYRTGVVWFTDGLSWQPERHFAANGLEVADKTEPLRPIRPAAEIFCTRKEVARLVRKGQYFYSIRPDDLQSLTVDVNNLGVEFTPAEVTAYNQTLDQFSEVFEEKTPTFPPARPVLHRIQTREGAGPTTSPMYRMGPSELAELKKILISLLESGLIEPSNSPYSAGVLLVPKPNGKWRLVTDYRKINAITVKSKYPLPRIDDIFAKVQGATCFTVLDCADGFWQLRIAPEDCHKTAFATPFGHYQFKVAAMGLCNSPASFQMLMNHIFRPVMGTSRLPQVSRDLRDPGVVGSDAPSPSYKRVCVAVYLDDILVYSRTFQDHLEDLAAVLAIMRDNHLSARRAKVRSGRSVPFLGHVLSSRGVATDPEKVQSIQAWPTPNNVSKVRSFLGIASYYRRFIPRFATLASPLNTLLKKEVPWVWSPECQSAFDRLKECLLTSPVLALPDPSRPYVVASDASKVAIGGVLLQDFGHGLQPIEYISRTMISAERNYPVHQQELLAVVYCCYTWRHLLLGAQFDVSIAQPSMEDPSRLTIQTDHRPLTHLLTQPTLVPRQARWLEYLSQFEPFRIQYVKGEDNIVPDALSRRSDYWFHDTMDVLSTALVPSWGPVTPYGQIPDSPTFRSLFCTASLAWDPDTGFPHEGVRSPLRGEGSCQDVVSQGSQPFSQDVRIPVGDPIDFAAALNSVVTVESDLERIISRFTVTEEAAREAIASHPQVLDGFPCKFQMGFLQVAVRPDQWRIYVPMLCRSALLYELHDERLSGHRGQRRLVSLLQRTYYWKGMRRDAEAYVSSCKSCQTMKPSNTGSQAIPLAIPDPVRPWDSIMMDFVGPFAKTKAGNEQLLVILDRMTRRCHLLPCPLNLTAEACAKLYLNNVFRFHGMSRQFISDKDKLFTSKFWQEFFTALGTKVTLGTAYHSSTSHLVERLNRVVQESMRHYVDRGGGDWDEIVPMVEFALNNSPIAAHGYTPFFLDTGQHPLTPSDLLSSESLLEQPVLRNSDEGVKQLIENLRVAQDCAIEGYRKARDKYMAKTLKNRDSRTPDIHEGDLVLLEGPRMGRFREKFEEGLKTKLRPLYMGPYLVEKRFNEVMYYVRIPASWKLKSNLFHRDQLKLYKESSIQGRVDPPAPVEHHPVTGEQEDEVEAIIAHKDTRRGRQFLVKWMYHHSQHDSSWRSEKELDGCARLLSEYKAVHHLT